MVRPYNTGSTLRTGGSKGIYQIQILQLAVNASTCGPAALADVSRCTDRYSFLGCDARESATTCEVNSCTSRHLFYNIQRTMYILRIKLTMYVILLQWIRWSITIMGCIIVLE